MHDELLRRALADELSAREAQELLRRRRVMARLDGAHVECEGRRLVDFSSNDYLGLTHHPRIIQAMRAAIAEHGAGAGASALISGYTPEHARAEAALARWKGTEAAVILPSGYQSAHAAIGTFIRLGQARKMGVRFLIDKLAHASLIDAACGPAPRADSALFRIFPHNDMAKLRRLLREARPGALQVVVTESIFSMDGDSADLAAIAQLKREYEFALVLDEAHASGVYGPAGAGYAAHCGLPHLADVSIVTLSKAMGLAGGAVCASQAFCEAMVNLGRAYIYSTAVAPALCAGVMSALAVMAEEPSRQARVRELAQRVRMQLAEAGMKIPAGDSPIVPIILGEAARALATARRLEARGYLVGAVRPPTVPRGTSRLRITLSCEHSDDEVKGLVEAVKEEAAG